MANKPFSWFRGAVTVAVLYGAVLLTVGLYGIAIDISYPHSIEWQLMILSGLIITFLPLVAIAWKRPRLGSTLLFIAAGATVVLALSVTGSTGDGTGAASVGGVGIVGLPMLATGLLFRWRSTH